MIESQGLLCLMGQGATNIEFLVISHNLRTMSVPNLVPEDKGILAIS
jgi:hypothetical protein